MNISNFKKTLILRLRNEGFYRLFMDTMHYILSLIFVYRRYILLSRSTSEPIPEINIDKKILIRIATPLDVPNFENIVSPQKLKIFSKLFKEGKICLVALDKDKIIYYSWISFEQKSFVGLKDKEAYFFDSYTIPKYRGLNIHTRATAGRLKFVRQKGYNNALAMVSSGNTPALKALNNLGFREVGRALEIGIPLLKLSYNGVIQKDALGVLERYHSFSSRYRKLNSCLLSLHEIFFSFFYKGFQDFYNKWKSLAKRELNYLRQNYNLDLIDKVIVVGAGAIPYTAIFFAEHLNKPVYAIEKNPFASFLCSRLLYKLNLNSIKVINKSGENYNGYYNSLIIINLQTTQKQKILKQISDSNSHNNIVVIRQPLGEYTDFFEGIQLNHIKYETIKQKENFESIVLYN